MHISVFALLNMIVVKYMWTREVESNIGRTEKSRRELHRIGQHEECCLMVTYL
uniref:Uncharacterized protein n=1 Tax=Arion vulgaris TaxID=1028688 RepID=A0A0B6ZN26_9EUPU